MIIGDIIKTSYGTWPYRIVEIQRGCRCMAYLGIVNGAPELPAPEHLHITCVKPEEPTERKNHYWLNRYVEEKGRIRRLDSDDEIIVLANGVGQLSLFDRALGVSA